MKKGLAFTMFIGLALNFILLSTLYSLVSTTLCGCQSQNLYKDAQVMMGTIVEVISPDKKAAGIVFDEIKRMEKLLSKYNSDSEVSKLNSLGRLKVSSDTFYIIKRAKEFWQISDGAFDITVAPFLDLWGFTDKKYSQPKDEDIKDILVLVGSDKIILNDRDNMIKFTVLKMKIDLGAIAKGYAVDCAIKRLREKRIKSCLVNAGGDMYCLGDKPRPFFNHITYFKKGWGKSGRPWSIAIQDPRKKEDYIDYLELKDKAVATSGDYEQYFIKDKKRYSHIFNPKTGYPADSGVTSVTVIASDCLTADALATSIFVLGKEKGQELAKKFSDVKVNIIEAKEL